MPDSSQLGEPPPVTQDFLPEEHHPERRRVGSFAIWLFYRIFIWGWTVGVVWILALPADRVTPRKTLASELYFLFGAVLVNLLLHPIAYGYADGSGLHFRQYLRMRFFSWGEFSRLDWKPGRFAPIILRLKQRRGTLRTVQLTRYDANPFRAWKQRHEIPEDVRWMDRKISEAQDPG